MKSKKTQAISLFARSGIATLALLAGSISLVEVVGRCGAAEPLSAPQPVVVAEAKSVFARFSPSSTLEQLFLHPPKEATPWVYWLWLRTPTTHEAMTRDMEEMKAKGISGFILYDWQAGQLEKSGKKIILGNKSFKLVKSNDFNGAFSTPLPELATWSPEWRKEICFVARESKRLGLDFSLAIGLATCSAPGLDLQYGQQDLVWETKDFDGAREIDVRLPTPQNSKHKVTPAMQAAFRDVAVLAFPIKSTIVPSEVQDISSRMDASGRLRWNVPPGKWRVLRFGQMPTGVKNVWGYYGDHLSPEGFDQTWALTVAPLLQEMTPEERAGLKDVHDDSWEADECTWTKNFAAEFQKRRKYDILPYLPILAGQTVTDAATAVKFKRDYAVTISDLEVENYYGHMRDVCHKNGLTLYAEANGPNYHGIDITQSGFHVDNAMGEFWMPSPHRPTPAVRFLTRDTVTSNHLKGAPITMCESFTAVSPIWSEAPFSLKACADQAFTDGVNRICACSYSHSPLLDAKPGDVMWSGVEINRNVTWWDDAGPIFDYFSRCSSLLQQGKFVADALFYIGDGIGNEAPMKVVMPTLGPGYDYDRGDAKSIIELASVKDGRIVLSTGMSYRVLVLPSPAKPMTLEGLQKIESLVKAGATVVGPPPTGLAGISTSPMDESTFRDITSRLWGNGTGQIDPTKSAREALQAAGVPPDFEYEGLSSAGEVDWIHRSTPTAEIYYVTSRWFSPEKIICKFRVIGRQPELWDPVTAKMRDAVAFEQKNGQTSIPLEFDPCGSVFVIFRKPIAATAVGIGQSNYPTAKVIDELQGPWSVAFDPKWGGPACPVTFNALVDWTQEADKGIKYFSGTAIYRKTFDLPDSPAGERVILDLGDVREIASVKLNGQDLGVLWTKPAKVDITSAVKNRGNDLEVRVTNLWPNRLIGDASLPPGQQLTKTNMHNYTAASPLVTSGLLGPVKIMAQP
jgi:hypothetical protein